MIEHLTQALTLDASADVREWARALWEGEQPDTRGFADRLAAAMLLATLDGVAGGGTIGRHAISLCSQRYAFGGLGDRFRKVFTELLGALTRKAPVMSVLSPRDVGPQIRQTAFFVSGVTTGNVVQEIKDELVQARAEGTTMQGFIERSARISDRTAGQLETVFRTNVAGAAAAGRWQQLNDPDVVDLYPAFRYVSRRKPTTRPLHRAMDGFTALRDDPIWKIIWPSNGFNCLCQCFGVSRDDAKRRGLLDEAGNVANRRVYASTLQEDVVAAAEAGMELIVEGRVMRFPDEGFRGNQLAGF